MLLLADRKRGNSTRPIRFPAFPDRPTTVAATSDLVVDYMVPNLGAI